MNFTSYHDFLDCLGWTLVHFLWQGLIIAALTAGVLRLLRRHSTNVRYLAGCFALLLMAAAPVATFYSLNHAEENPTLTFTVRIFDAADTTVESTRQTASPARPAVAIAPKPIARKTTFPELLEASLPWLVAAWSVGVLALSCRLFAGWLFIQKLRRSAILIDPLQAKLKQLSARIRVSRPIRLLQSAFVEVPTVIGWLRPIILLPASCLAGLTPAQLESILAHELAHIRRHDYLINLLQNIVETLLFYHPAVWWISRRIRAEREHCCDDLAVKICGDAAAYARALATLEELRPAPAQFALAATGSPLLERIRRLAGQPERSAVRPAWPVAGVIALLLLALLAAALRNNPASAQPATEPSHTNQTTSASSPTVQPLVAPFPLAAQPAQTNQASAMPQSAATASGNQPLQPPPSQPTFVTQLKPLSPATNSGSQTNASPATTSPPSHKATFVSKLAKLPPLPNINIKTKWVEIDAATLGTNTFMSFFATNDSQSLATVPATFDFTEYYGLQPTNLAEPSSIVFLHSAHGEAPLSAFLTDTQFAATIKKLEQHDGVDILTGPEVTTESGRQCQIQAVDINTILIGGSPPGTTNGPRALTNILTGPVADFVPRVSRGANKIDLKVIGTVTEFVGYENPATITNQNGKPMPKNWAIPRFRVRQFSSTVPVPNAQTFVLGAAPMPMTTFQKSNYKVPLLGDIPLLGHLFRSTKTSTSTAQKALVLLITPTLVNADGTRFVAPPAPKPDGQPKHTGELEPRTPTVNLEVKVAVIEAHTNRAPGFSLGNTTADTSPASSNFLRRPAIGNSPSVVGQLGEPGLGSLAGILSNPQYRIVLKALEQRKDVQFLHTRQMLDLDTNRTVTAVNGILTNGTQQLSFYPDVDITSTVARSDDRCIDLTIVSEIPEVSNFYNGANPPTDMEGNPLRIAGPHSGHSQNYTNNLIVLDGQTFVFSTPYPYDLPLATVSTAKKTAPPPRPNWNVMFFVTPTLMNADGTPYHTEQQRLSFQTNAPVPAK